VTDQFIKLDVLFGHVECDSRFIPRGDMLVGQGRSRHYDRDGVLVSDSGWHDTGIAMYWPEPKPRPWWKFWA
jgi:hypothetical protein